ncbi:MAG: hypothetical protein BGO55_10470 [Sphingobacteriales bacterium 50-39]|nr:hypothetical protein [Sphingobacteriales bacterium]OJW54132.1 MAG: hypothetical protein BGO55_10470 [Sphingobacteriales bacterium 50-39]
MKKVTIIALMVITIASSAFAGDNNALDFKGADAFKKSFPQATEVSYTVKKDFTEVNFTWHSLKLQAFFDRTGNYIGLSREISVKDLPLSYVININKEYKGFDITEAIEFDHSENGLSYYVTVIKEDRKYVLNVATDGSISVFKKMKS